MAAGREASSYVFGVESSGSTNQVFDVLDRFFMDLARCQVTALLPDALRALPVRNSAEAEDWLQVRRAMRMRGPPLGASSQFWVDEIEVVLDAVLRRLGQLSGERTQPPPSSLPVGGQRPLAS